MNLGIFWKWFWESSNSNNSFLFFGMGLFLTLAKNFDHVGRGLYL